MKMRASSTSSASRNEPADVARPRAAATGCRARRAPRARASRAPPRWPRWPRSRPPPPTRVPAQRYGWRRASRSRSQGLPDPPRTSLESSGSRPSESNTTRVGWRPTLDPGGEQRVVRERRADAHRHGVRLGAPAVRAGAARLAGDPLRVPGARGDLAVERHRGLEDHERPAGAGVLAGAGWFKRRALAASSPSAIVTSRPSSRRMPGPLPAALGWGRRGDHHARDARAEDRVRAGRRAALVAG